MKTPSFWAHKNFISTLLSLLGNFYAAATAFRVKFGHCSKVGRPVICIGNLTAGGTGKTPVAISIAKMLQEKGKNPFFISRGYGGKLTDLLVDKQKHTAQEVGDEPLLLSNQAPVIINSNRYLAAQKALKSGAEIIIMDDGFQNPSLHKDLSFLVFDGGFGYGNGLAIPAGPLRENLQKGLQRAQAIIIIGQDQHNLCNEFSTFPLFQGKIKAILPEISNKNIIAFAGIGRPEKFYTSLRELGLNLEKTFDFPDHHQYQSSELQKIINLAQKQGCLIFTTSKDFVKIPQPMQKYFHVLEIEIAWEKPEELADFILNNIK